MTSCALETLALANAMARLNKVTSQMRTAADFRYGERDRGSDMAGSLVVRHVQFGSQATSGTPWRPGARSRRLALVLVTVLITVVLLAIFAVGVPPLVRAAANLRARMLGRRRR